MSEDSDSKPYHYPSLERPEGASACRGSAPCGSMAQLHRMGGFGAPRPDLGLPSEGSDSSGADPPDNAARQGARSLRRAEDDVEMKSGGSTSGSGTESHGNESHGNDSRGNDSHGNESTASSNGNSKDSALLESSGSNKSSNSHSLSPAGSSNAFSLLSGSSEQNPSTSGCSSEESAKAKTQKELLKTLKELKRLLPAEKRNKGKSSTLSTLKYALNCVRQVEANEEYYQMLMINDSQPSGLDVSSYTIEEIDRITSEYTLKNNDMFAVAVSLATGKVVYISDQAAAILNCKRGVFKDAKFVEFLTPQDVSLFYSFTTPGRLPTWGMCTGAESSASDCVQEKSFFCRLRASGGKECEGDLQCYPFRMTPYLMKVQDRAHEEDQFCCLLLAERVHSGYEAPRIPTDKRIFTTTHTPNCVFQDVDERAVPLLGYLPQDLIGTQVLQHLHPKDRPIMLSIHKKILQYAGQPFDHSSVRFRARNGEYVVVDTSWSSFVNPWSRKVSFVIGRHKVRMGPVNEDVFVAPAEVKGVESDVQEITEQIHRLLLQTVHNNGSSGYGSPGSNDHLQGVTSSGESVANDNGSRTPTAEEEGETSKTKPRTFQEICKGIQRQKSQEQQLCLGSSAKPDAKKNSGKSQHKIPAAVRPKDSAAAPPSSKETGGVAPGAVAQWEGTRTPVPEELAFNDQTVYSYQQISCLDSVIRYLESCNVPITMKRKCHSSGNTTSSDEDKPSGAVPMQVSEEIIEDVSGAGETGEAGQTTGGPHSSAVSPPCQEREPYKKLGLLTKQVLAAHTEKEEQAFLYRFREVRGVKAFKADCSRYLERQRGPMASDAVPVDAHVCRNGAAARRPGRGRKCRSKRARQTESSDSAESREWEELQQQQQRRRCQLASPAPLRAQLPGAYPPMQVYHPGAGAVPPRPDPSLHGFGDHRDLSTPYPAAPLMAPMVALVLPNYMLPQQPHQQPFYQLDAAGCFPAQPTPYVAPYAPPTPYPGPAYPSPVSFSVHAQFHPQGPFAPQMQGPFAFPAQPFAFIPSPPAGGGAPKPVVGEGPSSRPGTPQSAAGARDQAPSPPLFQSRCSSPLQLNLLQLGEESQRSLDTAPPAGGPQGNCGAGGEKAGGGGGGATGHAQEKELQKPSLNLPGPSGSFYSEDTACVRERVCWDRVFSRLRCSNDEVGSHGNGNQSDGNSSSSDLLDILLQEDSRSGSGSATSGSMGSGLNGCGMSGSGTSNSRTSNSRTSNSRTSNSRTSNSRTSNSRTSNSRASASGASASGTGSNNSSNYFGSVDSSQNSRKVKGHSGRERGCGSSEAPPMEVERSQHFKYVLQDPPWLRKANADEEVMMTYQLPSRDIQRVLMADRERLRAMHSTQPCFTAHQKKELLQVHPWLRRGGLPKAINVKACVCCDDALAAPAASGEHLDLDMGETEMETVELGSPRKPRDELSSNANVNPGPCSLLCDS